MEIAMIITSLVIAVAALFWLWGEIASSSQIVVMPGTVTILYPNSGPPEVLQPGTHWRWAMPRKRNAWPQTRIMLNVATTPTLASSGPVDVTSSDGLAFRMGLTVTYIVKDPLGWTARNGTMLLMNALQREVPALAISQTLADLTKARATLADGLETRLAKEFPDIDLVQPHVSQLTLPPETRRLFIEVEKARLEGHAALERARGEQAALRALANAARLLKDNPDLLALRQLQAVSQGKSATYVLGSSRPVGEA